jgi:hypothetical protein
MVCLPIENGQGTSAKIRLRVVDEILTACAALWEGEISARPIEGIRFESTFAHAKLRSELLPLVVAL